MYFLGCIFYDSLLKFPRTSVRHLSNLLAMLEQNEIRWRFHAQLIGGFGHCVDVDDVESRGVVVFRDPEVCQWANPLILEHVRVLAVDTYELNVGTNDFEGSESLKHAMMTGFSGLLSIRAASKSFLLWWTLRQQGGFSTRTDFQAIPSELLSRHSGSGAVDMVGCCRDLGAE